MERWFLEFMHQWLTRTLSQMENAADRHGYPPSRYLHCWRFVVRWCIISSEQEDEVKYTLSGKGIRKLIDLRNLEQKEKENA